MDRRGVDHDEVGVPARGDAVIVETRGARGVGRDDCPARGSRAGAFDLPYSA